MKRNNVLTITIGDRLRSRLFAHQQALKEAVAEAKEVSAASVLVHKRDRETLESDTRLRRLMRSARSPKHA